MIKRENFIIIGAAGRNVGKTEFACELIANYAEQENVIGVKVTTIKEKDGQCPRGGEGCGVCSSLKGNYSITEEFTGSEEKDTVRMLNAGATKVYWLRVLKDHLLEGITELLTKLPNTACVICESNSSRLVLESGVFIVIKEKKVDTIKQSCKNVIQYADKIIEFGNNKWSVQPTDFKFNHGKWS